MSDRTILDAVRARLGLDAVARLGRLRRRLWWRRAVRSGLVAIAATTVLVALVQLFARAFPIEPASWIQGGIAVLALLTWIIDALRRRPSLIEAARLADEELGLRQRLGTALELAEHDAHDPLEARQLADARDSLHALDVRRAFRPSLRRRPLAVAGAGLALTLLLVAWPNPQDDVIDQRRAAREAAEEVAERVEDLADEIAEENAENPKLNNIVRVDWRQRTSLSWSQVSAKVASVGVPAFAPAGCVGRQAKRLARGLFGKYLA